MSAGIPPQRGYWHGSEVWLTKIHLLGAYYEPGDANAPTYSLVENEGQLTAAYEAVGSIAVVLHPTGANRTLWVKDAFTGTWGPK